jgi:hypothetical protein
MNRFTLSLGSLLVLVGLVQADVINGKLKSVDAAGSKITVSADGKDTTLVVAKDAKITKLVGKNAKKAVPEDVAGGLTGLPSGADIQVTFTKVDGKDVADAIRLPFAGKKKKNQ